MPTPTLPGPKILGEGKGGGGRRGGETGFSTKDTKGKAAAGKIFSSGLDH